MKSAAFGDLGYLVFHKFSICFQTRENTDKCDKKNFVTVPFNNMRTLEFKAQPPTNAFFASVNQMFGGSPPAYDYSRVRGNQIAEHSSETTKQCSAVVGRREEPPNT